MRQTILRLLSKCCPLWASERGRGELNVLIVSEFMAYLRPSSLRLDVTVDLNALFDHRLNRSTERGGGGVGGGGCP